jgi:hypothetical protein
LFEMVEDAVIKSYLAEKQLACFALVNPFQQP